MSEPAGTSGGRQWLPPGPIEETPDSFGAYPRLTDAQIDTLAAYGQRQRRADGEIIYREGDIPAEFFVVVSGKVAGVEGWETPQERLIGVHGRGRFLGELGLLTGQPAFVTATVVEAGEVLAVLVERLRELVADDPAIGDVILRAYLIRREMLIKLGAGLRIVGSRYSIDTRRLRDFAARNRLPHRWIDLEADPDAEALLSRLMVTAQETPVVIVGGTQVLRNPSNAELARAVGLPAPSTPKALWDLVVVGAGPAGLAAAVYAASEGLSTIVLDMTSTGGQAGTSSKIENYLGFPSGISGGELADRAGIQAKKFGAHLTVPAEATGIDERDGFYEVELDDGATACGRAVLIATGARYRKLDVPRLERFEGRSVYYAATHVEAQVCQGDPVAIVGGGNSAGQASLFLAQYASRVHLVVRSGDLGENMSRYLVDQIHRHPAVEVRLNTEVRELQGEDSLETLVIENKLTGAREEIPARALFVFIGAVPTTGWLAKQVALDDDGFVRTGAEAAPFAGSEAGWQPLELETNRRGVFAVGDVRSGSVKRVASAVGEGAMAVRMVHDRVGH